MTKEYSSCRDPENSDSASLFSFSFCGGVAYRVGGWCVWLSSILLTPEGSEKGTQQNHGRGWNLESSSYASRKKRGVCVCVCGLICGMRFFSPPAAWLRCRAGCHAAHRRNRARLGLLSGERLCVVLPERVVFAANNCGVFSPCFLKRALPSFLPTLIYHYKTIYLL